MPVQQTQLDVPVLASAPTVKLVHSWLEQHFDAMVADLVEFVNIETPSTDKDSLNNGLDWIQSWIDRNLPVPLATTRHDGGTHGDILAVEFDGSGTRPLTFLSHYDTVWEKGTLEQWPVTLEGDYATGPGIYDMKTGLVQSLWMMKALTELQLPVPPISMLFTGDEETGSPAGRPVIEEYSAKSRAVIVFEASEKKAIKTSRKGIGRWSLRITGKETHAGADYTAGISAIDELSRAVLTLHSLTDLEQGTTVNVGVIKGGSRSNVVAGTATADIDVRVVKNSEIARINAALETLQPHNPLATFRLEGGWNRPAMERNELTLSMFNLAQTAASAIGLELTEISVGGGSDGNFATAMGIPVLDGMGAVGAGPHSRSEHVYLSALIERGAVAAGVVSAFAL